MYTALVTFIDPLLFELAKQQNDGPKMSRSESNALGGGRAWHLFFILSSVKMKVRLTLACPSTRLSREPRQSYRR